MALSAGVVLHGRYRIESQLGEGGMGRVYLAWDSSLSMPVAIKENLDASAEARKQFESEARILARLSHPNLPRVIDHFFIPDQGQYLVMDYVEGEDLESMLRQLGSLPEPQVLHWISQICDALAYLHSQPSPVIHRDIKPANIKIRPDGRAMLVDFGIAKIYDPALLTTVGAKAVTPGYSPPEQYGNLKTDARSDIYALGATLYHLLTGRVPPDSLERIAIQVKLPPPRTVNPKISPSVEQAILRAVEVTPDRRFQHVDELHTALTQPVGGGQPQNFTETQTLPVSDPYKPTSSRSPKSYWLVGGSIAGLLLAAICVGLAIVYLPQLLPPTISKPTPEATIAKQHNETATLRVDPSATPQPTYTAYPTYTPVPSATPEPALQMPTAELTTLDSRVTALAICPGSEFFGLQCSTSKSTLSATTEAVYATWQSRDATTKRYTFTRRWYKDGMLILESSNTAGENARWSPSDGVSYYVYLSAREGTGKRLWNAQWLPRGSYRFELLVDGELIVSTVFTIQ